MSSTPKVSAPLAVDNTTSSPMAGGADFSPTRGDSVRAFVATLAGVPDLAPDDPHRGAKWAAGLVGLLITGFFVGNAIRGHKAAHRAGYAAGRAAAVKREASSSRARKR